MSAKWMGFQRRDTSLSPPVKVFLLTNSRWCFFCGSVLLNLIMFVFVIFLSVRCGLVVTCWERASLLALLYVVFYCVFVTSPCGVVCQEWCVIISIPDFCLLFILYPSSWFGQSNNK